jgi:hypothetical protein
VSRTLDAAAHYARRPTNAALADVLEFAAGYHEAEIAAAAMREAAKRLRAEPEPHYAVPPRPALPPLKAYADALEAVGRGSG